MNNAFQLLGLCQKAGLLSSGEDQVMAALKKRKDNYLVILAEDISASSEKKYKTLLDLKGISYVVFGKKEELGKALGKKERTLLIIHEKKLAEKIEKCISM